ncbi:HNH endonuclease [Clostridiaceae bacterium UIB06]|uniref:HNH endonuclease n=1 Tax=Clostridium thailandense TaxID=2794346 RepID=A0A949U2Y6_9CLOT|nr:HNH endonuclease [Clostridium thailandense]MBV7275399.1 HNH endonuclease [Clostridium thailandense]MCH5136113.1 HNH endonuclease [Clostridiaceae bacterium UIB06]
MNIKDTDKLYIYERDNKKCFFCGKPLKYNKITLDHYLPKSKKGTNDVFNLVTCCKFCNISKGNKIPKDYKETILYLFLKAVYDNRINKASLKISKKELSDELSNVDKVEDLTDHFVFQSNTKRFYIKNNKVYKIVHLASSSEDITV